VRGWEERGVLEVWVSTGRRRLAIVAGQSLGFLLALVVIAVGLAAGVGAGTVAAGAPAWGPAVTLAFEAMLVAAAFFGAGLLMSQLTRSARAGAGLAALAMVGLYLLTNAASDLGPLAPARFLSPFFYYQQSRVLVPGHGLDPVATGVLALLAVAAVGLAVPAFERRDLAAPLWQPVGGTRARRSRPARLRAPWLRDAWLADLRWQWLALTFWAAATAAFVAVVIAVSPSVTGVWQSSDLVRQLVSRLPGRTFFDHYMGYVMTLAAIAPAAFVVVAASRWVSDLGDRRVEMLLSTPVSRPRIVLEWALGALAGSVIVAVGVAAGCAAGALAAGVSLRADGLLRLTGDVILVGAAVGGLALLAVVVLRGGAAVGALSALLGLSFFVTVLGPLFRWPDWLIRLSIFDAFGSPYVEMPRLSGLLLLAGCAVVGTGLAALMARLAWTSER
jgi:ABC-2 type transport system permease protein